MKSDKNLIFADIVYFGFFASLAVMRGVNFNLNQAGGNLDEASCIPTGTDKQRNGKEWKKWKEYAFHIKLKEIERYITFIKKKKWKGILKKGKKM